LIACHLFDEPAWLHSNAFAIFKPRCYFFAWREMKNGFREDAPFVSDGKKMIGNSGFIYFRQPTYGDEHHPFRSDLEKGCASPELSILNNLYRI